MSWLSDIGKEWKKYPLLGPVGAWGYGRLKKSMPGVPEIDLSAYDIEGMGDLESTLRQQMVSGYASPEEKAQLYRFRSMPIERGYKSSVGELAQALASRGRLQGGQYLKGVGRLQEARGLGLERLSTEMTDEEEQRKREAINRLLQLMGIKSELALGKGQAEYQNRLMQYQRKMMPYQFLSQLFGQGLGTYLGMKGMGSPGGGGNGGMMDYSQMMKYIG